MTTLAALATELSVVRLDGALCRGNPDPWDLDVTPDPSEAIRICRRCPALDACRELAVPGLTWGVVAGELVA